MYEPSLTKEQTYDNRTAKPFLSEEKKVVESLVETEKEVMKLKGRCQSKVCRSLQEL